MQASIGSVIKLPESFDCLRIQACRFVRLGSSGTHYAQGLTTDFNAEPDFQTEPLEHISVVL